MTNPLANIPSPRRSTDEDDRIRNGVLRYVREAAANRRALPGELELIVALGCSRQQLRHSLRELESAGVLRRRQGAPTTVDPMALRMSVRLEEQFEHTELLSRLGYSASVEVLSSTIEPLPESIAALLEADKSATCLVTLKRWLADGVVAMVAEDRLLLPKDYSGMPEESVFTAVATIWGEPVIWEIATPDVAVIDDRIGGLLAMEPGSPVLVLEQIGVSASGRRLFYTTEYHRPGLVNYSFVRTVRPPWSTR